MKKATEDPVACKQTGQMRSSIIIAVESNEFFGGVQQRALDMQMIEATAIRGIRS